MQTTRNQVAAQAFANAITLRDVDAMMDLSHTLVRNPRMRDRAMAAAHRKDLDACEICGKAVTDNAVAVLDEQGEKIGTFGSDCAKRVTEYMSRG